MKRITIAKILSAVGSVMGAFSGDFSAFATVCLFLTPLLAVVSYCMCGFFKALGTPFSFAKWGFLIAPFSLNLLTVVLLFLVGLLSVAYIPVIPVFKRAAELGC